MTMKTYRGAPLLPAADLAAWLTGRPETPREIAGMVGVDPRRVRCIRDREQARVSLDVADRLVVSLGSRLEDVWPNVDELLTPPPPAPVAAAPAQPKRKRPKRRRVVAKRYVPEVIRRAEAQPFTHGRVRTRQRVAA